MDQSLEGQERVAGESWTVVAPGRVLEVLKQFVLAHQAEVVCACLLLLMAINLLAAISRRALLTMKSVTFCRRLSSSRRKTSNHNETPTDKEWPASALHPSY